MDERITRSEAVKRTRRLTRPPGVSGTDWLRVHGLLLAISEFYPCAMPGQQRLAAKLGVSVPTVKRYLAKAVAYGLVEVQVNEGIRRRGHGGYATNHYRLTHLSGISRGSELTPIMGIKNDPPSPTGTTYPPVPDEEDSFHSSSSEERRKASAVAPLPPVASASFSVLGAGPDEREGPKGKTVRHRIGSPTTRTVNHFEDEWGRVVRRRPELSELKHTEPKAFGGWLKYTFYGPKATHPRSEESVMVLIDRFMDAIIGHRLPLRRATVWKKFAAEWQNFLDTPSEYHNSIDDWVKSMNNHKRFGLWIYGHRGSGVSAQAQGAIEAAADSIEGTLGQMTAKDLITKIRNYWDVRNDQRRGLAEREDLDAAIEELDEWWDTSLILIDNLHDSTNLKFWHENIHPEIESRLERGKPVIVASSLAPSDMYGKGIVKAIEQRFVVVEVSDEER